MGRFTTAEDAKNEIIGALGEFGEDYDVDGIFRAAYDYRVDIDADGNELLNTAGFEQTCTDDEFWTIVDKHDKTAS